MSLKRSPLIAFTLIELMIVIAIIAILAAILVPYFIRCRSVAEFTGCKENLKNIATSIEMYANDNKSVFPTLAAFVLLTPNYLSKLPICAAAQTDTYSSGYQVNANGSAYTLNCQGTNHQGAGVFLPNYPQYNTFSGLAMP